MHDFRHCLHPSLHAANTNGCIPAAPSGVCRHSIESRHEPIPSSLRLPLSRPRCFRRMPALFIDSNIDDKSANFSKFHGIAITLYTCAGIFRENEFKYRNYDVYIVEQFIFYDDIFSILLLGKNNREKMKKRLIFINFVHNL